MRNGNISGEPQRLQKSYEWMSVNANVSLNTTKANQFYFAVCELYDLFYDIVMETDSLSQHRFSSIVFICSGRQTKQIMVAKFQSKCLK
jgi:hypothetical protein